MSETPSDQLNEILAVLSRNVGLPGLAFTDNGYCALTIENGRIIHLQQEDDSLLFFSELGQLAEGRDGQTKAIELLEANAFWIGTNGSTLAMSPKSDQIILTRREKIDDLTANGIEEPLGDFIESAELWANQISSLPENDGDNAEQQSPPAAAIKV